MSMFSSNIYSTIENTSIERVLVSMYYTNISTFSYANASKDLIDLQKFMRGLSVMHTADEPMKRLLSLALFFHFRF